MYRTLQQRVVSVLRAVVEERYGVAVTSIGTEQPPSIEMGELATPVAFELAKRLRKAPRVIAGELATALGARVARGELAGVAAVELAGAGYLNLRFDRAAAVMAMARGEHADVGGPGFRLVEHTSINPNKAAHIGHLRNAILGDTFQRLLRRDGWKSGWEVGVQNYIDNTGVQVADVVVGFVHLKGMSLPAVRELMTELVESNERFDYFCWELYAQVSQWYGAEPEQAAERKALRLRTLHAIEQSGNETAAIADEIATAVLRRHLQTMERLGIEYDFLPRESEILSLHFWDAARALMLEKGVLYLETEGKNKGCYVMRRAGAAAVLTPAVEPGVDAIEPGPDEDAKVIVRSNGTVTYVGKDIAYHLWKFGLLPGKDFGYQPFYHYPQEGEELPKTCWISAETSAEIAPPSFGHADAIYNVIDSRQNDPQNNVIEALRGMGYAEAADRYTHFSYEMVALTPRCAIEMGYPVSEEDRLRPYLEVSGRKGFGVKADDLLDRMIGAAQAEVEARHPELSAEESAAIARQIGVGALRYFMLRFTRNTVIAFDFKDALSFEGETGPYVQYAIVRAENILRKAGVGEAEVLEAVQGLDAGRLGEMLAGEESAGVWETWLLAGRLSAVLEQAIATAEPAHLARYAFQLAQQFNNFYHRHHVLKETDAERRVLLLATAAMSAREMTRALGWMGIEAPVVM